MKSKELFLANVKKYIRPQTDPVAIKLVFGDEQPPEGMKRPTEKFGYPLAACQGVSAARRLGLSLSFEMPDHACPPSMCVFGYLPKERLLSGQVTMPGYAGSEEAAKKIEAANIILEAPPRAIWFAPYETAQFEPDIVLVYGNSAQATRLAQGYAYYTGDGVKSYTLGRLACASYVNKVYVTQEPTIVIPGGGERAFGTTGDDELVFALPVKFLETTALGIEAVHKAGYARYPTGFAGITAQPKLPGQYYKYLMPKE